MHPAHPRPPAWASVAAAVVFALAAPSASAAPAVATAEPGSAAGTSAAGTGNVGAGSPQPVCDHAAVLTGPTTAPAGAVTVPAGDNSGFEPAPRTTYWFAPGTHTLGDDQFGPIIPADGDVSSADRAR